MPEEEEGGAAMTNFSLTLSYDNVNFILTPSNLLTTTTKTSSSSSIVSVKQQKQKQYQNGGKMKKEEHEEEEKEKEEFYNEKDDEILADLSEFTGTLRIFRNSPSPSPPSSSAAESASAAAIVSPVVSNSFPEFQFEDQQKQNNNNNNTANAAAASNTKKPTNNVSSSSPPKSVLKNKRKPKDQQQRQRQRRLRPILRSPLDSSFLAMPPSTTTTPPPTTPPPRVATRTPTANHHSNPPAATAEGGGWEQEEDDDDDDDDLPTSPFVQNVRDSVLLARNAREQMLHELSMVLSTKELNDDDPTAPNTHNNTIVPSYIIAMNKTKLQPPTPTTSAATPTATNPKRKRYYKSDSTPSPLSSLASSSLTSSSLNASKVDSFTKSNYPQDEGVALYDDGFGNVLLDTSALPHHQNTPPPTPQLHLRDTLPIDAKSFQPDLQLEQPPHWMEQWVDFGDESKPPTIDTLSTTSTSTTITSDTNKSTLQQPQQLNQNQHNTIQKIKKASKIQRDISIEADAHGIHFQHRRPAVRTPRPDIVQEEQEDDDDEKTSPSTQSQQIRNSNSHKSLADTNANAHPGTNIIRSTKPKRKIHYDTNTKSSSANADSNKSTISTNARRSTHYPPPTSTLRKPVEAMIKLGFFKKTKLREDNNDDLDDQFIERKHSPTPNRRSTLFGLNPFSTGATVMNTTTTTTTTTTENDDTQEIITGDTDCDCDIDQDEQNNNSDCDSPHYTDLSIALTSDRSSNTTTPLHVACTRHRITVDQLRSTLERNPGAASTKDIFGRFPLHVLAQNRLAALRTDPDEMEYFLRELLQINPGAIMKEDLEGNVPFISNIAGWVDEVYTADASPYDVSTLRLQELRGSVSEMEHKQIMACTQQERRLLLAFPPVTEIPPFVKWSIQMLSVAIDHLNPARMHKISERTGGYRQTLEVYRRSVIDNFASVPYLFKTILLLTDDFELNKVLSKPIFRASLLSTSIVDFWLVPLMRSDPMRSRAVTFLELISNVSTADLVGRKVRYTQAEKEEFQHRRMKLFETLSNVEGLIPSMLALGPKLTERASTTRAVHFVLDKTVRSPYAIGYMLFDMILHLMLMTAYRMNISYRGSIDEDLPINPVFESFLSSIPLLPLPSFSASYDSPTLLAILISFYFLAVEFLTVVAMILSSKSMVKAYFHDFWNIVDVVSVALAFGTSLWIFITEDLSVAPGLVGVTVGLLWLRFLSFLKTLNMELATFTLAIIEIIKEMRWFLLVMTIGIFLFSDMLEVISKLSGICPSSSSLSSSYSIPQQNQRLLDAGSDFCSNHLLDGYARVYSVIVGDVALDDFKQSPATVSIFVVFTFFGVIVLLNILIAIVEDAYSKAKIRSFGLFGRARVEFVARHLTRDKLLQPVVGFGDVLTNRENKTKQQQLSSRRTFRRGLVVGAFAIMNILLQILLFEILSRSFFTGLFEQVYWDKTLTFCMMFIAIFFEASLLSLIVLTFRTISPDSCLSNLRKNIVLRSIGILLNLPISILSRLMGLHKENTYDEIEKDEEWLSKLQYIERRMRQFVDKQGERVVTELKAELKATESRIGSGSGGKQEKQVTWG